MNPVSRISRLSHMGVATAALSCIVSTQVFAADDALEAVVVTATRTEQPVSEAIGSVTVITRAEIEKRQAQSVLELLQGEAGIDIANNGGLGKLSSVFLRGANSNQTLILVNGVRLGSATAGTTSLEYLPVDQIERIEIVRGPRSSLYGSDAIGGVIQIFTRNVDGFSASMGSGSNNTQDYSSSFGLQGDALRFSVSGNYIQSEGFNSCVASFSGGCYTNEPDNDGYRNTSGTARLGYAFGEVADLELSTLYSQGFSEFDGSFQNEVRFRNTTPTAKLRINPSDALNITLSGGITQDRNDNYKNSVFASRFNTEKRNGALQADWRVAQNHTLTVGADYLDDVVTSNTQYTATSRDNKGVFAQYLGKLGAHEISGSVRQDDNEQFGDHTTGNAGWKWFVLDQAFAINAGWGSAFHAPTFNDLYYPYGYSNPNLKPERSQSYELGFSGAQDWLNWSLQAYSTEVKDLIVFTSIPNNVSEARLQGAELTLNGHWDQFTAGLNYTAQNPRSKQAGANYDHILQRRARQSGRIDLGYDFGTAQIGSSINVVGKRYDDLANLNVLPGYTTVDFKGDVTLGKGFALQVKLGNFFDRHYETARFYNQEGRSVYVTLRYRTK
ncbi:MAG: TonB-dependent receptor [Steroidobacteraceae bacterium]